MSKEFCQIHRGLYTLDTRDFPDLISDVDMALFAEDQHLSIWEYGYSPSSSSHDLPLVINLDDSTLDKENKAYEFYVLNNSNYRLNINITGARYWDKSPETTESYMVGIDPTNVVTFRTIRENGIDFWLLTGFYNLNRAED